MRASSKHHIDLLPVTEWTTLQAMNAGVRIKICGVTTVADAQCAVEFGADALGLNFYPPSPRSVDPAQATAILRELPPFVEPVGVFARDPLQDVCARLQQLGMMRTIQWHGDEHELYNTFPFRLIPAFAVRDEQQLEAIRRYLDQCGQLGHCPAAILIDAQVAGLYGGTGERAPWHLLADFQPGVPVILAGGLTPENVAEAVRIVRPYAVDVASGVESSPGRKDREKMRKFIGEAREPGGR